MESEQRIVAKKVGNRTEGTHWSEGAVGNGTVGGKDDENTESRELLANIYLHEVLDQWFEEEGMPRLKGKAFLIRYADDAVMGFAQEEDARRAMKVLPKRLGKYGLTLHPESMRPAQPPTN